MAGIAGALVVMMFMASAAMAADCGKMQKMVTDVVVKYADAKTQADRQYVGCLFAGGNEKGLVSAVNEFKAAQKMLLAIDDKDVEGLEKCLKMNGDIQALIVDGAKQCGESMGRMITACSEKAVKLLQDEKLSNDERVSRITQLITDYLK